MSESVLGINSFAATDYEHIAALMRQAINAQDHNRLRDVLASNFNIVLAALDIATVLAPLARRGHYAPLAD